LTYSPIGLGGLSRLRAGAGDLGGSVLSVNDLSVVFQQSGGDPYTVVDGVSFAVTPGKCVGIVGESGSGKSMTCLALMGLVPTLGRAAGEVLLEGQNLLGMSQRELRVLRGSKVAMVFQDPSAALNPLLTVRRHVVDVLRAHGYGSKKEVEARALEALVEARFPDPIHRYRSYPFQLSGGLRQRVAIAMALACKPTVVLADEPTTNLDASVQDQVLELFRERMDADRFGMVFVSHDLGVISKVADRVLVMYGGRMVESGPTQDILRSPAHPYTQGLLAAAPSMSMDRAHRLVPIPGVLERTGSVMPPCAFASRCPKAATPECQPTQPRWHQVDTSGQHWVHCHTPVVSLT
jgi:oligopeptide/dipeptide ABC transporter ATP-binding protein